MPNIRLIDCKTEAETLAWYRQAYSEAHRDAVYWSGKAHEWRARYRLWWAVATIQGLVSTAFFAYYAWKEFL